MDGIEKAVVREVPVSTSYCMSARAIRRILASSPRAAGPRASANIMTYSLRTHAITSLLHDEVLALWSVPYIIYWHSGTFELVGYHATNSHVESIA